MPPTGSPEDRPAPPATPNPATSRTLKPMMHSAVSRRRPKPPAGWLPEGGLRTLAALRIVTGLAGVTVARSWWRGFEVPPESLHVPPPGTSWLGFLPVTQPLFLGAAVILAVGSGLLAVGWRPQWTASIAAAAFFYAGWVTTLTGKVDHSHHVMWVLVVLAVSPCANAWSVRRENRAGSYRVAVLAVICLIGLIYFGAGLQKITTSGLAWGWSDNLINTMMKHAWEKGQVSVPWLVEHALAGKVLGLAALVFELSFLPLLLYPKTRRWVWPAGLMFHWGTWLILGISFLTLQVMYVVFSGVGRPPSQADAPVTPVQRRVLVILVGAVTVFTLTGSDHVWPVSAYPGFATIADGFTIDFELVGDDGEPHLTRELSLGIPTRHVRPFIARNVEAGRGEALLEWVDAQAIYGLYIDTRSGTVVDRWFVAADG